MEAASAAVTEVSAPARHPLAVRLCHWINALCIIVLLMSGLCILNFHPAFYWGEEGHKGVKPWVAIEITTTADAPPTSRFMVGDWSADTTGIFGNVHDTAFGTMPVAISPALILPTSNHLGEGRALHFLTAWIFALTLLAYLVIGLLSGRFWGTLRPRRSELTFAHIKAELRQHLRFKRIDTGAQHYNLFQKLAYIAVIFGLLPTMVLSGLTMSTAMTAAMPWLLDLFGGRQTARTLHFLTASTIMLFFLVHVILVVVTGFSANMRAMITGARETPKRSVS